MASDKETENLRAEALRAQARAIQAKARDKSAQESSPGIAFLNRGIAQFIGAPVDLANAALSFTGLGSEEPVGGSRSIERGLRAVGVGVPRKDEEAEGANLVLQSIGGGIAGLPLAPAFAFARGGGALAQSARQIGQTAISAPGAAATGEVVGAAGAGIGQVIARKEFPDNDLAEVSLAMLGGFGLPAVSRLKDIPVAQFGKKVAGAQIAGFTEKGKRQQAMNRLAQLTGKGRVQAQDRLATPDVLEEAKLTPAQKTGNRRLLALEQEVIKTDVDLEDAFRARFIESNRAVKSAIEGLGGGGDPKVTRNFIATKRDYIVGLIGERVKRAHAAVEQRLSKLAPSISRESSNTIFRQELDSALESAVKTERQIWDALPLEVEVGTTHTSGAIRRSIRELRKGETLKDLPKELRRFVKPGQFRGVGLTLNPAERASVLHKARSRALEAISVARAKGRRNEARILNRYQQSILADLGAIDGQIKGEIGDAYRTALHYSRTLNNKFRKRTVGRLLGFEEEGSLSTPESLTLERSVAGGGPEAAVAVDDLLRALDDAPPGARRGLDEMVRNMFVSQAAPAGNLNAKTADRFLVRNEEFLNRFPEIKADIEETVRAGKLAQGLQGREDRIIKGLRDRGKSAAALYLNSDPDTEIRAVMRSQNPRGAAQDLVRMAKRDRTRGALDGLQTSVSDFLVGLAGTRKFDDAGVEFLSGRAMRAAVHKDPRVRAIVEEVLTSNQRKRLDVVIRTLERMELVKDDLPNIGGIIDKANAPLMEFVATTIGARLGAQAGSGVTGASLKTAQAGSKRAQAVFNAFFDRLARVGPRDLLSDAIKGDGPNSGLLQALLEGKSPPPTYVHKRLNAWLLTLGDQRVNAILEEGKNDDGGE